MTERIKTQLCCNAKTSVVKTISQAHIALQQGATSVVHGMGTAAEPEGPSLWKWRLTMSTDTLSGAFASSHIAIDAGRPTRTSVFKRLVAALVKGQEARARKVVHAHLGQYDDAALARLGWSRADIAALRTTPAAAVLPI
jgi:hypothetical protein